MKDLKPIQFIRNIRRHYLNGKTLSYIYLLLNKKRKRKQMIFSGKKKNQIKERKNNN